MTSNPKRSGQPVGDQRAVAGRRGRLDAHQRTQAVHGQPPDEGLERDEVEDLLGVDADILGGEPDAGALADALAVVLAVLEVA